MTGQKSCGILFSIPSNKDIFSISQSHNVTRLTIGEKGKATNRLNYYKLNCCLCFLRPVIEAQGPKSNGFLGAAKTASYASSDLAGTSITNADNTWLPFFSLLLSPEHFEPSKKKKKPQKLRQAIMTLQHDLSYSCRGWKE